MVAFGLLLSQSFIFDLILPCGHGWLGCLAIIFLVLLDVGVLETISNVMDAFLLVGGLLILDAL